MIRKYEIIFFKGERMKKNLLIVSILVSVLFVACAKTDSSDSDEKNSLVGTWKISNVSTPGGTLDITLAFSTGQLIAITYTAGTATSVGNHSGIIVPSDVSDVHKNDIITYTVQSKTGNAPNVGTIQKFLIKNYSSDQVIMDVDSDNDGTYDMPNLTCVKQ
jgi:major membrane immunogen (membrane-anchored lipoprotein)